MRIPLPDETKEPRSLSEAVREHTRAHDGSPPIGSKVTTPDGVAEFIGEHARTNLRLEVLNDAGEVVKVIEKQNLGAIVVVINETSEPTVLNGIPGDFCEFNVLALAHDEALEKMAVGILDFIDSNGMLATALIRLQLSRMHASRAGGTVA